MSASTGRALITDFVPYVEIYVPRVPRPYMIQTIHDVLIEFFRETQAFTCLLCAENIRAGISDYEFARPNRMVRVDQFKRVWFDDLELSPAQPLVPTSSIREVFPVQSYARLSELEIRLLAEPTQDILGGLEAEAVLTPTRDSETIPCDIFETNYEGIVNGVVAKLKAIRGKAWSDRSGSQHHYLLFNKGKQEAIIDQNRFGTNRRTVVIAPRLFAGGRSGRRRR